MKPFKEVINYPTENSFVLRYNDKPHFNFPWHFHNEYEMVYVISSTGKRFTGDVVDAFGPGDFAFFGTTLPHFYHNDKVYYLGDPNYKAISFVLQFPSDYFNEKQLQRPEFANIKKLLVNSSGGLKFSRQTNEEAAGMLHKMYDKNGLKRYLLLIELLDFLGRAEFSPIASPGYTNILNTHVEDRMIKVYEFSTRNYNRKITLNEVSNVAGMNSTAFCRYFKEKEGKTYAEFINDLRINYACKLLRHGNQTVAFVCNEAGFNNLSNFNRQFKVKIGKSPSEYREFVAMKSN